MFTRGPDPRWENGNLEGALLHPNCRFPWGDPEHPGTINIQIHDNQSQLQQIVSPVAQPGGGVPPAPLPRNWVHKKIPGCAVELNTQILHGLAAKYP